MKELTHRGCKFKVVHIESFIQLLNDNLYHVPMELMAHYYDTFREINRIIDNGFINPNNLDISIDECNNRGISLITTVMNDAKLYHDSNINLMAWTLIKQLSNNTFNGYNRNNNEK